MIISPFQGKKPTMSTKLSYPRIYTPNNNSDVLCQIIRNDDEMKSYLKIAPFRRCLIEDLENFILFKNGNPPYNQDNIRFAIKNNLYKAFTE